MSEDIDNLLNITPKGQMSSSRTGFPSHGNCPTIAHQCFNFCDPPSRQQHAAFVNAKGDCVSGPAPFRKSPWPTTAPQEVLNQQLDHSRGIAAAFAVKATSSGATIVPISQLPQHPVPADPYQCCKPSSAAAWEPYPPPSSAGGPGRLARPAGSLVGQPHLHACYGPPPSIMVPLPPPPTSSRPQVAPRHPAGSSHPSGYAPRPGGPTNGMPPPASHQHAAQPHQAMGAPSGQLPATTGPSSTPGASAPTSSYPASTPPPPLSSPPPGAWPWPWSQSHPLPPPPVATASPPANAAAGGAAGDNSSDGGWSANGGPPNGGPGGPGAACRNSAASWRLEDDDAAEDALQELLLEEIAAAPWPHVHIPSLRAAGVFIESYHSGRYEPALFAPWPLPGMPGPPPPMPHWTTASAPGMAVKQITTWEPLQMPPPLPPSMPHQPHLNPQQQLPISASSLPPMAPPLPPPLPPQPKHLVPQQVTSTQSEMVLPQAQSASAADGLLLPPPPMSGSGNSMMEVELGLQTRNDDALFAAWLTELGTGPGSQATALGSTAMGPAAAGWGPQSLMQAAPPPGTSAAVVQHDSDYNRASFVSSPNSASMPTTPTVTNGRQRSDTGCCGGFTLSASASAAAAAAVPSQAAAAAAAAAAVSAAVAVVAVVEAAADTAAAEAAAAAYVGVGGKARVEEAMVSDDGEAETVSGGLNAGGGGTVPVLGGPGTGPGVATAVAVNYDVGPGGGGIVHSAAASLREQIYSTFDLPVADAARVLGISATELKRRCRRLGISRWPQRKLQSLRRIVQAAETDTSLTEDERKAVVELAARNRDEIMADPDAPLVDLLKTVRQTQYKQSFEKRAAAAAASRRAPPM